MTSRAVAPGVLVATLLWQLYVVIAAAVRIPQFRTLFSGLGAELPVITRALFLSYRFWFVVPVLFLVLTIDLLRHPQRSATYVGLLVFAAVTSGFVMQAWLYEGCLMPLLQIMRTLGWN
jgi:hypothetical protein